MSYWICFLSIQVYWREDTYSWCIPAEKEPDFACLLKMHDTSLTARDRVSSKALFLLRTAALVISCTTKTDADILSSELYCISTINFLSYTQSKSLLSSNRKNLGREKTLSLQRTSNWFFLASKKSFLLGTCPPHSLIFQGYFSPATAEGPKLSQKMRLARICSGSNSAQKLLELNCLLWT